MAYLQKAHQLDPKVSKSILNAAEARKGYYAAVKDFRKLFGNLNSGINPEMLDALTRMAYYKIREGMATLDQFVIHIKQVCNKTDLTPEERDMVEQAWKKGGEDVETGVSYADEMNETPELKPKENGDLVESSLNKASEVSEVVNSVKVIEEDGYAIVRGSNNEFVARAWLGFDNELNLTIITKGTSLEGKGREVFQSLFNFINTEYDEILKIRGTWRSSDSVADNLNTFNDFIRDGLSPDKAALKTFTGKMAVEHKFTNAKVLSTSIIKSDGTYSSVDVLFTK